MCIFFVLGKKLAWWEWEYVNEIITKFTHNFSLKPTTTTTITPINNNINQFTVQQISKTKSIKYLRKTNHQICRIKRRCQHRFALHWPHWRNTICFCRMVWISTVLHSSQLKYHCQIYIRLKFIQNVAGEKNCIIFFSNYPLCVLPSGDRALIVETMLVFMQIMAWNLGDLFHKLIYEILSLYSYITIIIEFIYRMIDGSIPGRVRELLPVFDAAGFCKIPPPASKTIKPRL